MCLQVDNRLSTYVSVDDVSDGCAGVVHCSGQERDKRGVMHVYLVYLVEDLVDQTRVYHVLRLHRNHVFLKQFQVHYYTRCIESCLRWVARQ